MAPAKPRLRNRSYGGTAAGHVVLTLSLPPNEAARFKALAATDGKRARHVLTDLAREWIAIQEGADR